MFVCVHVLPVARCRFEWSWCPPPGLRSLQANDHSQTKEWEPWKVKKKKTQLKKKKLNQNLFLACLLMIMKHCNHIQPLEVLLSQHTSFAECPWICCLVLLGPLVHLVLVIYCTWVCPAGCCLWTGKWSGKNLEQQEPCTRAASSRGPVERHNRKKLYWRTDRCFLIKHLHIGICSGWVSFECGEKCEYTSSHTSSLDEVCCVSGLKHCMGNADCVVTMYRYPD